MRNPTLCIGLASGQEGWLTVDLDSVRFCLEIENGKRTVETLNIQELKMRLPITANVMAQILAEAVRTDRKIDH